MAEAGEFFQVAPRSAAKIQDAKGRLGLNVLQQGSDVLADVVVARALPKRFGAPVVMRQSTLYYGLQLFWIMLQGLAH